MLAISANGFAQFHAFRSYIPAGFTILGRATADINGDGNPDWVVALRNPYENMNPDTTRPLLLLLGNGKGGYRLIARNDSVVLCNNCGGIHGDPFQRVTAGEGWISVRHFGGSGWRWTRVITFRYDRRRRQFLLAADGGRSWHVDSPKNGTRIVNRPEDFGRVTFHQFSYNRVFEKK
jgi:hypothetical protein